jgi:membrane-bound ClpP family serine protease
MNGETVTLDLGTVITTTTVDMTLLERLLAFISSPNVAFLLVSLGGLGVIVELWNPGMWIPGTLGVLFLILGWAGIGQLPFSWAGVSLITLSLLLFYLETTAPGLGYFGAAGTISLVLGGLFLVGFFGSPGIPGDAPVVNRWLLAGIASQGEAYQALSKPDGFDQFGRRDRGGFGYLVASRDACRGDIHVEGPGIRGSRERRTLDRRD